LVPRRRRLWRIVRRQSLYACCAARRKNGVIEGITEFLPISSAGHLLIAEQFLGVTVIYRKRLIGLSLHVDRLQSRDYPFKLTMSVLITARRRTGFSEASAIADQRALA
jgi:bacitracin resistance protein BacA